VATPALYVSPSVLPYNVDDPELQLRNGPPACLTCYHAVPIIEARQTAEVFAGIRQRTVLDIMLGDLIGQGLSPIDYDVYVRADWQAVAGPVPIPGITPLLGIWGGLVGLGWAGQRRGHAQPA